MELYADYSKSCALRPLLWSLMPQQPIFVLGDGNVAGDYLNNVGNTYITQSPYSERGNGTYRLLP